MWAWVLDIRMQIIRNDKVNAKRKLLHTQQHSTPNKKNMRRRCVLADDWTSHVLFLYHAFHRHPFAMQTHHLIDHWKLLLNRISRRWCTGLRNSIECYVEKRSTHSIRRPMEMRRAMTMWWKQVLIDRYSKRFVHEHLESYLQQALRNAEEPEIILPRTRNTRNVLDDAYEWRKTQERGKFVAHNFRCASCVVILHANEMEKIK